MFVLRRISTVPGSALTIQIDQAQDGVDGGFQVGGVFQFMPKGQDGDHYQVTEHAARVVMKDPGLAPHFVCEPPLPADEPAVVEPTPDAGAEVGLDSTSGPTRAGKKRT